MSCMDGVTVEDALLLHKLGFAFDISAGRIRLADPERSKRDDDKERDNGGRKGDPKGN